MNMAGPPAVLYRRVIIVVQIAALASIVGYLLYFHFDSPSFIGSHAVNSLKVAPNGMCSSSHLAVIIMNLTTNLTPPATLPAQNLTGFVQAVLNPSDTTFPKVECPRPDPTRYAYLKPEPLSIPSATRYFFALNLRNNLPLLPQLLGSIVEAIRFLGPQHCALSIVEGNSPDGTAEVLAALEPELARLGIRTHFTLHNPIDPLAQGNDRFQSLATLRNLALAPLLDPSTTATPTDANTNTNTTILFINDVALCPDDILELAHQRLYQNADMACAMDWTGSYEPGANPPTFYDVYVARARNGDLFFDVPPDTVSWARATDLFWNEPVARARLARHAPFQVFACWNGAVAVTARPLLLDGVRFRGAGEGEGREGECRQGEPGLFCKDLWWRGYGRIMVVPSVNLEYGVEKGGRLRG